MSVAELMKTDVRTVTPRTTIREAFEVMDDFLIRHLPVVDERGNLIGIVSDRDLLEFRLPLDDELAAPAATEKRLDRTVEEAMSHNTISVEQEDDVGAAVDVMLQYKVGAVPVVRGPDGELVGIVSYVDVLRLVRPSL